MTLLIEHHPTHTQGLTLASLEISYLAQVRRIGTQGKKFKKLSQGVSAKSLQSGVIDQLAGMIEKLAAITQQQHAMHIPQDLSSLCAIWPNVTAVSTFSMELGMIQVQAQFNTMLAVHALWRWYQSLDPVITAYAALQPTSPASSDWLTLLIEAIRSWYTSYIRGRSLVLDRKAYWGCESSLIYTIPARSNRSGYPLVGSQAEEYICQQVKNTLCAWMEFPASSNGQARRAFTHWEVQGRFIDTLLRAFASDTRILLFQNTWDLFEAVAYSVFGCRNIPKPADQAPYWKLLESHTSSLASTPDAIHLLRCMGKMHGLSDAEDVNLANASNLQVAAATIAAFFDELMPLVEIDETVAGGLRPSGNNASTSSSPLIRYVSGASSSTHGGDLWFIHPDQHNPFRETAPTRWESHPITKSDGRSASVFFSLATIRAITYGTTFPYRRDEEHKIFHNLDDFMEEVAQVRQSWPDQGNDTLLTKHHLVTQSPYGQATAGRSIDAAHSLWQAATKWEEDMANKLPISWATALDWVHRAALPQMRDKDSLTRYLFLCDLSYTGFVLPPNEGEVGEVIFSMKRGALSYLLDNQLLEHSKGQKGRKCVIDTFSSLVSLVACALENSCPKIWFDARILEHALCKMSRISKKAKLQIPQPTINQYLTLLLSK